jgi:hypothetical protein
MHLSLSDSHSFNLEDKKKAVFTLWLKNLKKKTRNHTIFRPPQILKPIADVANQGDYDLLLIGLENYS